MTGIYLRCDRCEATLGGEQVSPNPNGLHWSQERILREEARKLGWTGPLTRGSEADWCPKCTQELGITERKICCPGEWLDGYTITIIPSR